MPREFSRTDRLGAQMQRDLAVIVRNELDDPRLGMVTLQEVRVVRDLSHATVFFTVLGGTLNEKETAKSLNEAAPFLRHELGRCIKIRTIPELHFVHDDSLRRGNQLSDLIDQAIAEDAKHHHD
jgi:ribosome-binding factor A